MYVRLYINFKCIFIYVCLYILTHVCICKCNTVLFYKLDICTFCIISELQLKYIFKRGFTIFKGINCARRIYTHTHTHKYTGTNSKSTHEHGYKETGSAVDDNVSAMMATKSRERTLQRCFYRSATHNWRM